MTLPERILATIRKHGQLPPGGRVLAAVSGGADSVALAIALARLAPDHGFTLAGLAHLHHGLRGHDADADETFVQALAARLAVPFFGARADVASVAGAHGESIEAAARRARYAFLSAAALEAGATAIATGHTADDQAETLVLRLMRGAGLAGLSAIRPVTGIVIRPLLDSRRADVEAFLRDAGESWREDASNADRAIARNRVRHEVMPVFKAVAGDAVIDALARTAALIQDDAEELDRQAIEMARSHVLRGAGIDVPSFRLDIAGLRAAGPALGRRVVRTALGQVAAGCFQSLEHVEAVRSLMKEAAASSVQVPGAVARRDGETIVIVSRAADDGQARELSGFEMPLPVPGRADIQASGLVVTAEVGALSASALAGLGARHDAVAVQGVDAAQLTVRSRRPGDVLRPLGAPGRRKLQDVFVDRKVARRERDRVPLVVDDRGRIVWVVGHTIADEFRVTAPGGRVLLLTVRRAVGDYI
ncbi:MAG: tRNA lysidine(34) synthetase TilS [Acidobacteriota bacterium]|nr:tRNA lysidine(34) synthetase TilS [Acidobacteriota bacterium]